MRVCLRANCWRRPFLWKGISLTDPNARLLSSYCVFTAGGDGKDWDTTLNVNLLLDLNLAFASFTGLDQRAGRDDIPPWHQQFVDLALAGNPTFSQVRNGLIYVGIVPHHGAEHDTFEFDLMARMHFTGSSPTDPSVWEVDIPNETLVNRSARLWHISDGSHYSLSHSELERLMDELNPDQHSQRANGAD